MKGNAETLTDLEMFKRFSNITNLLQIYMQNIMQMKTSVIDISDSWKINDENVRI
jgi:hypothetical protein